MTTLPWKQAGLIMALLGATSFVQAQDSGSERPSREEMLKKYDTDGDGQLSEAERSAMREARGGKDGPQGDNKQSRQGRMRPSREEMLKKYDTDGDGQLSEAERSAMREARGGRGGPEGEGRRGGPGNEGDQGKRGGKRPSREEMLKKYDTDGDGMLSEDERSAMRQDRGAQQ